MIDIEEIWNDLIGEIESWEVDGEIGFSPYEFYLRNAGDRDEYVNIEITDVAFLIKEVALNMDPRLIGRYVFLTDEQQMAYYEILKSKDLTDESQMYIN